MFLDLLFAAEPNSTRTRSTEPSSVAFRLILEWHGKFPSDFQHPLLFFPLTIALLYTIIRHDSRVPAPKFPTVSPTLSLFFRNPAKSANFPPLVFNYFHTLFRFFSLLQK